MPHDKIRSAARDRQTATGEPYTAARRAVAGEHPTADPDRPPSAPGYALAMSDEIHDWLDGLRGADESAALRVTRALVRLMREGASLGPPTVTPAAGSWSWSLAFTDERSYQDCRERLEAVRWTDRNAAVLIRELQDHLAELEAAVSQLDAGESQRHEAGSAQPSAPTRARLEKQAAEIVELLPRMKQAHSRLSDQMRRLQARVDAVRVRREVVKAGHAAAHGSARAREALAAMGEPFAAGLSAGGQADQMDRDAGQQRVESRPRNAAPHTAGRKTSRSCGPARRSTTASASCLLRNLPALRC